MPRKKILKKCEQCEKEFIGNSVTRFCSRECSGIASILHHTGKKPPKSILDVSSRTVSKILKRLGLGCSNCGWNMASCDIHHINGRSIDNADRHTNLTLLCPNCHRLAHEGVLTKFTNLKDYIGDRWLDYYYG